jgi:hypothetical protein
MAIVKRCFQPRVSKGVNTPTIRDGPLDIWGGGWAITKKKFAQRNNPEKKYRAQHTYWKKKSSKD